MTSRKIFGDKSCAVRYFFGNKPNNGMKPLSHAVKVLGGWIQARNSAAASKMETGRTRIRLARRKPCFFFGFNAATGYRYLIRDTSR